MSYIDTIKLGRLNQSYDVLYDKNDGVNTVTTLTNLPVTKNVVLANLAASSPISLAGSLKVGEELQIICNPTADFGLEIGDNIEKNFEGSIIATNGKKFGLNIVCYNTGKYFLTADVAVGAINIGYEYTFNITPAGATVKINGSPIQGYSFVVKKGTTVRYSIELSGYVTKTGYITGSEHGSKTINITLTRAYKLLVDLKAGDLLMKDGGFRDKTQFLDGLINRDDISGVVLSDPYTVSTEELNSPFEQEMSYDGKYIIDVLKISNLYYEVFTRNWINAGVEYDPPYSRPHLSTLHEKGFDLEMSSLIISGVKFPPKTLESSNKFYADEMLAQTDTYLATREDWIKPDKITVHYSNESNLIPFPSEDVANFYLNNGGVATPYGAQLYTSITEYTNASYVYYNPPFCVFQRFLGTPTNLDNVISVLAKYWTRTISETKNKLEAGIFLTSHTYTWRYGGADKQRFSLTDACTHNKDILNQYYMFDSSHPITEFQGVNVVVKNITTTPLIAAQASYEKSDTSSPGAGYPPKNTCYVNLFPVARFHFTKKP